MRTCPSCGFGNAESADSCQLCGRGLVAADLPVEAPLAAEVAEAAPALPIEATPAPLFGAAEAAEIPEAAPAPVFEPAEPAAPILTPTPPATIEATNPPPVAAMPSPVMPPSVQWAEAPGSPPPMMPPGPPPARPPLSGQRRRNQFLLGLGTGFIPLIFLLVIFGFSLGNSSSTLSLLVNGAFAALIMYAAALISMIVCLSIARVRFIGYGLLTAVASSPAIAPLACTIISNLSQYFR